MYLKSIEIHGFKSFANRINFQFHKGITGIVGPNGSGKSNVADAVRWVLGEQRIKQLRGSNMQDVIFSGTEARKPMGYAYVAITLDNSDHALDIEYDEVTIARRLYRSGESEYLLNGTACRLKDVSELFYDTGIGKEGYSIIGQGQIDRILSDKPEERRELFDEAAGIVKFKRRKEVTQKKLDSEQTNLIRVNDILSEIEKQLGPLERQSEKAQIYLQDRERLKKLDVNLFLLDSEKARNQLKETERLYGIATEDLDKAKIDFDTTREEYDKIEAELEELEKTIEEKRNEISRTSVVREQLEGNIKGYQAEIDAMKGSVEQFTSRSEKLKSDLERAVAERDKTSEDVETSKSELDKLETSRTEAAQLLSEVEEKVTGLEAKIEEGKSRILTTLDERADIKSRLASIETKQEQIRVRKSELTGKLVNARTDESRQDEIIAEAEKKFENLTAEIVTLRESQNKIDSELTGMKSILASKDEELRSAQIAFHSDETKLETLRNMTERYEGFGQSVKRVMEKKSDEHGLIGVVADLLKTDEKFEVAIEVALGGSIQNVVTDNEATTQRMISFLKREKAGRVTFLPLTEIKNYNKFSKSDVLHEPGIIGTADTLIHCDDKYKDVAGNLLGRTIVADSEAHASAAQRKYQHSLRIVTLDGELYTPGGAISGGEYRNNSNLLSRRREIAELEKKIALGKKNAEDAQQAITDTKNRRNILREQLAKSSSDLSMKQIEQNTARINVTMEKEKQAEAAGSYEQLKAEDRSIKEQTEDLTAEKDEISRKLSESEKTETEISQNIEAWQKERESVRKTLDENSAAVAKWDLEIGKMRQSVDFKQQNLDRLTEDADSFASDLGEVTEHLEVSQKKIISRRNDIDEIQQTILSSHSSQDESEKTLKDSTLRKEELTAKQKDFFDRREKLNDQMTSLDKECFRLKTAKERQQEALDSKINYLWDEYQVTPSDAEEMRDEELKELSPMKKEIDSLKQQIRDLGSVNVNAIDEYKETRERHTFLKTQHDDLIKAAENLQKIISELDISMRKQFKEQFAKIAAEFDTVFKEMFGGGHGSLELVEDEDLLEAGIRVIAQPPGKKLINIMQMSGGEKALTAIALLFAIQNLKPSPFCLLDEIEAALDESNVGRFADYLRKLSDHTQFIVITHRRGTMDRADRLYGITMQEKGVSTLVSVNLIDKELTN
ncbi:MAG: chromosome segregation protein SMC [Lachnospiraceae bacterium]|nr:chromosome segregation protein SMC [Lachnospiraceae bacterium]